MVKKTNKNRRNKRRETRKKTPGLQNMSNSNNSNYNLNIRRRNVVIPPHLRRPNHQEIPTFNPPPPPPSMNTSSFTSSLGNYQPTPQPRQRGVYRRTILRRDPTNGRIKASDTINTTFDPVNAHELYQPNYRIPHVPNENVRVVNIKKFNKEQKELRRKWRQYKKNEQNRQNKKTNKFKFKYVKGKTKKKQNTPSAKELTLPQTAIRTTSHAPQASVTYANLITKPYNSNYSSNNESVTYPTANNVNRNNRRNNRAAAENLNVYHIREPANEYYRRLNNQINEYYLSDEYNGNYNGLNNGEYYLSDEYNY